MEMGTLCRKVYVTGPHVIDDPKYTSEAHRAAAADPEAPEGMLFLLRLFLPYLKRFYWLELKPYGWWFPVSSNPNTAEGYYAGFKESIEHVKKILIEQGPFDGVFGFSQGCYDSALNIAAAVNFTDA